MFSTLICHHRIRYTHIFFFTVWIAVIGLSVQMECWMMTDFRMPWWLRLSIKSFSRNIKNKIVLEMENDLTIFVCPYVSFRFLASTPPVRWLLLCENSGEKATRCRHDDRQTTEYQTLLFPPVERVVYYGSGYYGEWSWRKGEKKTHPRRPFNPRSVFVYTRTSNAYIEKNILKIIITTTMYKRRFGHK